MTYWHWLLAISALFAVLERLHPARREQPQIRSQLLNDLFYVAFNGHFYALLTGSWAGAVALWTRSALDSLVAFPSAGEGLGQLPWWGQFAVYFVVSDFLQWCIHNLLHRVPFLWQFHKVHHSAHRMDWAVNFRFHWMELVVYRSLLYVPLTLLGGEPSALFAVAVAGTAWGHFNHSNLDVGIGPLGKVFNSPQMHMWHHDDSTEGGVAKNFAIVLSLWDWLFGTAYWPRDRAPERLGYRGDGEMPQHLPGQVVFPAIRQRSSTGAN